MLQNSAVFNLKYHYRVHKSPPVVQFLQEKECSPQTPALFINPLNAELNPIYHLLALLGAHHILHVSRIRVKVPFEYYLPTYTYLF